MDFQNFSLFAAGGSLIVFWQQIKGAITRISSVVIKTASVDSGNLSDSILQEILPDTKLIFWGNPKYMQQSMYLGRWNIYANLTFNYFKSYPALYKKKIPILLSENGQYGLNITFLAGTFPIEEILSIVTRKDLDRNILVEEQCKRNNHHVYTISVNDEHCNCYDEKGKLVAKYPEIEASNPKFKEAHYSCRRGFYITVELNLMEDGRVVLAK